MLFSTLFTIVSFLPKFSTPSPMYNVPPDRLITNIGSFARNIRNVPCISRRSNEKGVCMFAIDCQKSNGTHLGTCIDRFYFGSCCHIDPLHEIIGNTIDAAIIPSRQPPSRISSTTSTPFAQDTDKTTIQLQLSTLQNKLSSTLSTSGPEDEIIKNITTIIKPTFNFGDKLTSQNIPTTPSPITTISYINKFTPTAIKSNTTEISYKLTTFQTVEENTITAEPLTTQKFIFNYTKTRPTLKTKPATLSTLSTFSTNSKPKSTTSKPTLRPRPTVTRKPTKTLKPSIRPVTTTTKVATKKPPPVSSTLRFTNTKITKKPTTSESATTKKYITEKITTQKFSTDFITKQSTNALKSTSTSPSSTIIPENVTNVISTISIPITTEKTVVENEDTNEIEQPKPLQPPPTTEQPDNAPFVTWEVINNEESTLKPIISTENSMPISTSNEWILVPNLTSLQANDSPITTPPIKDTTYLETTSGKPVESFPSSTNAPFNYTTDNYSTVNISTTISVTRTPNISSTHSQEELSSATKPGVNMTDFTDVCGRRLYPEARIVGGERAAYGKWPWQISLRQWRTSTYLHKCGAALLNENWAITAAHCVDNVPPSDLLLRLGEHDLSTDNEPYIHQERRVQIVASHPQFDPRTFEYDLALLRFYEPVQFQPNIIPVCVPNNDENFVGRTAHVTGWGRLYEDGPLPSVLQEVSVPVINNTVCESMYRSAGYIEHIPHIFICAGWRRGGFDSCEGDSGGPMVIQRPDKRFLLAGVISWGIGCAEPNQPGVYTRISEFRDWINQILQF